MSYPEYEAFLRAKVVVAQERGSEVNADTLNPQLFPHQRDLALWAIRGGNRAIFASFGLGKTLIQLQIMDALHKKHQDGAGLIVCPLGVKAEFVRDAKNFFGIHMQYVPTNNHFEAAFTIEQQRFFLTNYERVRDGNIDPNRFQFCCSLDESSVLRSFGSKTYQTFLTLFDRVPYKYVATATPNPNRTKELIHYAGFLGIMDTGQALTRFFKRDSTSAGNLQLHPHKEREFWLWVSTWATFLQKPSDLGYSDEGYDLPPLNLHWHRLPVDHLSAGFDSWGQGKLLRDAAASLRDASREKRDSILARVAKCAELVEAGGPERHWIIWHDLEDERRAIAAAIPDAVSVFGTQDLDEREANVAKFSDGEIRILSSKPVLTGFRLQLSAPLPFCHLCGIDRSRPQIQRLYSEREAPAPLSANHARRHPHYLHRI